MYVVRVLGRWGQPTSGVEQSPVFYLAKTRVHSIMIGDRVSRGVSDKCTNKPPTSQTSMTSSSQTLGLRSFVMASCTKTLPAYRSP